MSDTKSMIDLDRKPVPFHRLVDVEFRKLLDTRAGFWLLAIMVLLVAAIQAVILLTALIQDFPMSWGLLFVTMSTPLGLLLAILGIMTVTSEWGQRTSLVTFSLEPRRLRVIAAKLVAGVAASIGAVLISIGLSAIANGMYGAFSSNAAEWDMTGKDVIYFVIFQLFGYLLGFAFGMLVSNTAVAIVLFFFFRFVVPGLMLWAAVAWSWFADLKGWVDFLGALGKLESGDIGGQDILRFASSAGVWVILPLVVGTIFLMRREIK